jgi:hypothetical protein
MSASEAHLFRQELYVVRFEVFTAMAMKNAVFWDIETQFVPHRRYVSATESSRVMPCEI